MLLVHLRPKPVFQALAMLGVLCCVTPELLANSGEDSRDVRRPLWVDVEHKLPALLRTLCQCLHQMPSLLLASKAPQLALKRHLIYVVC
jgi:hypothetical protein